MRICTDAENRQQQKKKSERESFNLHDNQVFVIDLTVKKEGPKACKNLADQLGHSSHLNQKTLTPKIKVFRQYKA